jgi:hypothetical protein
MRRRVCRWREEGGKGGKGGKGSKGSKGSRGIREGERWLLYGKLGWITSDGKSESFALALKKKNGQPGAARWRRFVTGRLRFQGFLHLGELQLGLGQGLYDETFGVFRGEVASGGHFTDQEILGAL